MRQATKARAPRGVLYVIAILATVLIWDLYRVETGPSTYVPTLPAPTTPAARPPTVSTGPGLPGTPAGRSGPASSPAPGVPTAPPVVPTAP